MRNNFKVVGLAILFLLLAGAIFAYAKWGQSDLWPRGEDNQGIVSDGPDLSLKIGQTGRVGDISITLNSFVADYRCPVDAECMEAGAVVVNVTFRKGDKAETFNMPSDEAPRRFEDYRVSIVDVRPPLRSDGETLLEDLEVTFLAESDQTLE